MLRPPIVQRRLLCGALFSNTWGQHPPNTQCAYLSGGVEHIRNDTPMFAGAHFFLCFPCSVALHVSRFATPPMPKYNFCVSPTLSALALRLSVLQLRLLCGALFSNTWSTHPPKRNARNSQEVFNKSELALPCLVALTFLCFPCSVALRVLLFLTPLRRECFFLAWAMPRYARQYSSFACAAMLCCPTLGLRCPHAVH